MSDFGSTGATSEQIEAAARRRMERRGTTDRYAITNYRIRIAREAADLVPPGYRIVRADADALSEATREALRRVLAGYEVCVLHHSEHNALRPKTWNDDVDHLAALLAAGEPS